jgi:hypothetical protein
MKELVGKLGIQWQREGSAQLDCGATGEYTLPMIEAFTLDHHSCADAESDASRKSWRCKH